MSQQTTVVINDKEISFSIGVEDYNRYLNEQMPNDKVAPAYNFLIRTVDEKQKEELKKLIMVDGKPNGLVVVQVAGSLAADFAGGVQISIKKPKG